MLFAVPAHLDDENRKWRASRWPSRPAAAPRWSSLDLLLLKPDWPVMIMWLQLHEVGVWETLPACTGAADQVLLVVSHSVSSERCQTGSHTGAGLVATFGR